MDRFLVSLTLFFAIFLVATQSALAVMLQLSSAGNSRQAGFVGDVFT